MVPCAPPCEGPAYFILVVGISYEGHVLNYELIEMFYSTHKSFIKVLPLEMLQGFLSTDTPYNNSDSIYPKKILINMCYHWYVITCYFTINLFLQFIVMKLMLTMFRHKQI